MRFALLLLALIASGPALAQGPCAEVRIHAFAEHASPYDGTLVELFYSEDRQERVQAQYSALTDARGHAVFTSLSVGEYVAVVSREGFEPEESAFMCLSASRTRLNFALSPSPEE